MIAVSPRKSDRFVADPPKNIAVFLLHGEDIGLISERGRLLLSLMVEDVNDPFQVERFVGNDVADDPATLMDAVDTIPLFGGQRAMVIELGTKSILPALEMILAAPPHDCRVLIEAGSLRADAPIRRLVEQSPRGGAIICNPDSERDVAGLIDAMLAEGGLAMQPSDRARLARLLGADRLSTRTELAKLQTFAHGQTMLSMEDVEDLIADTSTMAIEATVNAAFLGQDQSLDEHLRRVFAGKSDPGTLLLAVLRHAHALHRARLALDGGKSASASVETLARINIGGSGANLERQLRAWSAPRLLATIQRIHSAIAMTRRMPHLAESSTVRLLWGISRLAGSALDKPAR